MNKWLRRLTAAGMLLFALLAAVLAFLAGTEAGLRCLATVSNRLSANVVAIGAASGSLWSTLHLRNLRYDDGVDVVAIDSLDLTWDPSSLLDRRIRVLAIHGTGVQVRLGDSTGETVLTPFYFPASLAIERVSVEGATIFSNQEPIWQIETASLANVSYHGQNIAFDDLALISKESAIRAKGSLQTGDDYPLQWTIEAVVRPEGYQPIAGQGAISGPINQLHINADLSSPFPAHLDGRLNKLLGATTWEATVHCPAAVLAEIHPNWPEQRFTDVVVNGRGTLDAYGFAVRSAARMPTLKQTSALAAELDGDFNGIRVQTLELAHGASSLTAKGRLTWNPGLSWEAEVRGAHIDPSLLFADWPGDFSCTLNTEGSFDGNDVRASFHLPQLQGTLRRFPLSGKGEAHLLGRQVRIPMFALTSAGSGVNIQGEIDDAVNLALKLQSGNLAELWPNARGKVDLNAKITGPTAKPEVALKLTGAGIGLGADRIEAVDLETKGTVAAEGSLAATLKTENAQLGSIHLIQANAQLKGSLKDHTLVAEARTPEYSTGFTAQGALSDHNWQGTLRETRLSDLRGAKSASLRQQQPAALSVSPVLVELKPICLASPSSARLCVNGSWLPPTGVWQMHGSLAALPMQEIGNFFQAPWPVEGQLDAALDLNGQHAKIIAGKTTCDAAGVALHLHLPDGGEQRLQWQKNSLRAEYANSQLQTTILSELTDESSVHAAFKLTAADLPAANLKQAPVQGTVQIRVHDLSPIALLSDNAVHLSGAVQGQAAVTGAAGAPLITGKIELVNGQAEIPPLGITLAPLFVNLQGDAATVRLQASARSGKGELQASSAIQLHPSPSLGPVHLIGRDFQAVHLPGLEMEVSPDLQIILNQQHREIRGEITIPKAKITSIDLDRATPPSSDIVVIDDDQPAALTATNAALPLYTEVNVIAGDDVQIDAYGLRGAVTGNLQVIGQPGRPQVGNGTLNVRNGSFTVYGRRLKIDLGRLLFSGGPLTNPGIELRSENKKDKVTTGVIVDGFLQHPNISFYSTPAMEQSAIVSNLLESTAIGGETRQDVGFIGKAADKAGLGGLVPYLQSIKTLSMIDEIKLKTGDDYNDLSLVFGSWITPDFYVGYGKDLVKESGSFNTRYTLGAGFSFLTETGASQSGGDLLYEFEW
jgi:translocation and assembly module TamB